LCHTVLAQHRHVEHFCFSFFTGFHALDFESKHMPPRKGTKRSKGAATKLANELNWDEFDQHLSRMRVESATREQWNAAAAAAAVAAPRPATAVKKQAVAHLVPITPDMSLSDQEIFDIGSVLLDSFDADELNLSYKINPAAVLEEGVDRAPGVTDEQIQRWTQIIEQHALLFCDLHHITFKRVKKLLVQSSTAAASAAENDAETEVKHTTHQVELSCFLPLMWFAIELSKLPLLPQLKYMYFADMLMHASYATAGAYKNVWHRCMTVLAARQQDIADFMWRVQQGEDQKKARH
jgi:hypothetical protein